MPRNVPSGWKSSDRVQAAVTARAASRSAGGRAGLVACELHHGGLGGRPGEAQRSPRRRVGSEPGRLGGALLRVPPQMVRRPGPPEDVEPPSARLVAELHLTGSVEVALHAEDHVAGLLCPLLVRHHEDLAVVGHQVQAPIEDGGYWCRRGRARPRRARRTATDTPGIERGRERGPQANARHPREPSPGRAPCRAAARPHPRR